jgi:shikimate kinase
LVLATGGGAVMDPRNRAALSARGFVVYLHASVDHQLARTERSDNRPLLQVADRRDTLNRLFQMRDPLYRKIADLIVHTDGRNARTLVREIEEHLALRASADPVNL